MWTGRETEQTRTILEQNQREALSHPVVETQANEENVLQKLADKPRYISSACEHYPY